MNRLMHAALTRTLASPAARAEDAAATGAVTIINQLPIPLYLYVLGADGAQMPVLDGDLAPVVVAASAAPGGTPTVVANMTPGAFCNLNTVYSGAYVTSFQVPVTGGEDAPGPVVVGPAVLAAPNHIGPIPQPNTLMPIPTDSPRVLVGCSVLAHQNILCREQYWERAGDSYVMAPGTRRTVSTTTTSGIQKTSSEQYDISLALGFSASAGWGPISASISGSLSASSSTMQQVFVSNEVTQYESLELSNTTDATQMFFRWQLMDVFTIFAPVTGQQTATLAAPPPVNPPPSAPGGAGPIASIVMAESPTLISDAYDPANLPPPPSITSTPA